MPFCNVLNITANFLSIIGQLISDGSTVFTYELNAYNKAGKIGRFRNGHPLLDSGLSVNSVVLLPIINH